MKKIIYVYSMCKGSRKKFKTPNPFPFEKMNTTRNRIILQMLGTFSSAIAGPMAGVFLMGMFIPWTNTKVNRYNNNIVLACELFSILRIYKD